MPLFIQSDIEKASKLGFIEGSKGLPPPDATDPDLNEAKFYAKAVSSLNKTAELTAPKVTALTKKSTEIADKLAVIRANVDSLRNRSSLEAQIDSRLKQSLGLMVEAKKQQLLREAELNAFKLSNGLLHPANYPEDMARHMSWVAITLAIETVINATFFAGANGLVIGALIALTFAAVNLGISFLGGIFFRGKNAVQSLIKIRAWIIFSIIWIIIFSLNLLTAAYRSESAKLLAKRLGEDPISAIFTNQVEAFQLAKDNVIGIFHGSFPFADLNGLILMFVGLLAAVIAMWKGYGADDPYPRYGNITRSHITAANIYIKLENSLKGEAQGMADRPLQEVIDTRQAVNSIKQQSSSLRKGASDVNNEWRQNVTSLNHEYRSIVDVYRKSVRSVKPNAVPNYFELPVELKENDSMSTILNDLDNKVTFVENEIEAFSAENLPFLADTEQAINNERSTLLGGIVVAYLEKINTSARNSI